MAIIEAEAHLTPAPVCAKSTKKEHKRKDPKLGTVTKEGLIVGRGTNKKVIPFDEVDKLARLHCSYAEIAKWFDIPEDTLKYNFRDRIEQGYERTKQKLRSKQLEVALGGNVTMLIWLGKNMLGQTDTQVVEQTHQILPWTD